MIVAPPLLLGALKLTAALALEGVALTDVGEPGTNVSGVTAAEEFEAALLTALALLLTANV